MCSSDISLKKMKQIRNDLCPCGRGQPYSMCCARYHAGAIAPDAESLMRSRYTAYVLHLETYLLDTWHASTRPTALDLADNVGIKWTGLRVEGAALEGNSAWVLFTARYKVNGKAEKMSEKSRFVKEAGCWFYLDGEVAEEVSDEKMCS